MGFLASRRTGLLTLFLLVLLAALAVRSRTAAPLAVEETLGRALERPLVATAHGVGAVTGFATEIFRREHLRERVATLEAEVARLALERGGLEEAKRENDRLQALLGLKEKSDATLRAARVVASDATGLVRSVVIDLGTRDGVAKDAAVLAPEGLVGRVFKVGTVSAVVQLVSDAASGMGVVDERSRVQGVLVGSGKVDCRVKYVPNLEDVKVGDRILASGLDGIYPRGALVGVVSAAHPGADAFVDLHVQPAAPLSRLETVLVVVSPAARPGARLREGLAEARAPAAGEAGRGDRGGRGEP